MLTLGLGTERAIPWLAPADAVTSGRVVPWPEFDGAYNPDTSLVIVDNVAKEFALAKGLTKP